MQMRVVVRAMGTDPQTANLEVEIGALDGLVHAFVPTSHELFFVPMLQDLRNHATNVTVYDILIPPNPTGELTS